MAYISPNNYSPKYKSTKIEFPPTNEPESNQESETKEEEAPKVPLSWTPDHIVEQLMDSQNPAFRILKSGKAYDEEKLVRVLRNRFPDQNFHRNSLLMQQIIDILRDYNIYFQKPKRNRRKRGR